MQRTAGNNMSKRFHFISGLPRSGSTLLCAILRQNPAFTAGMSSPVAALALSLLPRMSASSEFASFFDDERRRVMLRGVFSSFYHDIDADVIFDTNRIWSAKLPLLMDLFPTCKVICCVREIGWIIDSFERLLRKNPTQMSRIFQPKTGGTLHSRVETLMNPDGGVIGSAWTNLREGWYSHAANRLLIINYENFAREPDAAMRKLYTELEEPFFQHDFENISYKAPEYDEDLGMPGLHTVRGRVSFEPRPPCIPPDIFETYAENIFWSQPLRQQSGPAIIC